MIEEDKKLILLKDLSGRIPYSLRMHELEPLNNIQINLYLYGVTSEGSVMCNSEEGGVVCSSVDAFKPYLFPMSSMTDEQREELNNALIQLELKAINNEIEHYKVSDFEVDFYNKHHFDYRGLIDKGLAIDAKNLNIY